MITVTQYWVVAPGETVRLSYRFVALEPQQVSLGRRSEREESIRRQAQACFDRLDPMIRSYPEQWYNFFDYWEA